MGVSRFTFARGNARKVASIPLYGLGALASLVVPRRPGTWVIGCGSGVGEGALALYLEARAADPSLTITWMARNNRDLVDAAALGIPAVPVMSWPGFWLTLRAEVIAVTHGFGDANRFGTRGAFIVQLWHGIPLKHIHLDSAATVRAPFLPNTAIVRATLHALYRRAATAIALLPAASEVSAERLRTAFGLGPDRVVVTGDPRDDVLAQGTAEQRRSTARARIAAALDIPPLGEAPVLLHAPTWRDGAADPALPTDDQWRSIAGYLDETGAHLLVRPHPLGVGDYGRGTTFSPRIHLLGSDLVPDITPVLPSIDTLVTDYSSIAYDFSLTGGTVLFLAPDVASYAASRGLYEPYGRFSGGREVNTWDEVLAQLRRAASDSSFRTELAEHTAALARRFFDHTDGNNTVRVYGEIVSRLKGTA